MYCVHCGKEISDKAVVCVGCGVPVKHESADADKKSKVIAGLLALFLGGLGVHKFYHGHPVVGTLYALFTLFCWVAIGVVAPSSDPGYAPVVILILLGLPLLSFSCVVEGIIYLTMKKSAYDERYNKKTPDERTNGKFNREVAPIASLIIVGLCLLLFPTNFALRESSAAGNFGAVKLFLALGANVNTENKYGSTPLILATYGRHLDIVEYLIDHGADVNVKNEDGNTPLWWAANEGHTELVRCLIDKGADVNAKGEYGYTPLFNAGFNGNLEVFKYLIENGANVNIKSNNGYTLIYYYPGIYQHIEVVKYLIEKKLMYVNAKDKDGGTPLHCAVLSDIYVSVEVTKYLIDNGADVNAKDNNGNTPFDLAKTNEIKKILRDAGGKSSFDYYEWKEKQQEIPVVAESWWTAFEEANKSNFSAVVAAAKELDKREVSIENFYDAYIESEAKDTSAILAYLDEMLKSGRIDAGGKSGKDL
jgi:hypothetical protein